MSSTNKKALVYVRSARYDDDTNGRLQQQTDELKQAAAKDGYTDVTVIEMTTPSGKSQFDSLIKEVESGKYGAVYVYEISRISRDYKETRKFFHLADELGITVNVATEPQLSDGSLSPELRRRYLNIVFDIAISQFTATSNRTTASIAYQGKRVGA